MKHLIWFSLLASVGVQSAVTTMKSLKSPGVIYLINSPSKVTKMVVDQDRFTIKENVIQGTVSLEKFPLSINRPSPLWSEEKFLLKLKEISSMVDKNESDWDVAFGFEEYQAFCISGLDSVGGQRSSIPAGINCVSSDSPFCQITADNIKACIEDRTQSLLANYRFDSSTLASLPKGYGITNNASDWWGASVKDIGVNVSVQVLGNSTECRPMYDDAYDSNRFDDESGFACSLLEQHQQIMASLNATEGSLGLDLIVSEAGSTTLGVAKDLNHLSDFRKKLLKTYRFALDLPYDGYVGNLLLNKNTQKNIILQNVIHAGSFDKKTVEEGALELTSLGPVSLSKTLLENLQVAKINAEKIKALQLRLNFNEPSSLLKTIISSLAGEMQSYNQAEEEMVRVLAATKADFVLEENLVIKRVINIK